MNAIKQFILVAALASLPFLSQNKVDPAAWGSNHVGKPIPEYVTAMSVCFAIAMISVSRGRGMLTALRCDNAEDAPELEAMLKAQSELSPNAATVEYFLGSRHRVRF